MIFLLQEGPRTMVGIATFDSTIHFYNLKRALQQVNNVVASLPKLQLMDWKLIFLFHFCDIKLFLLFLYKRLYLCIELNWFYEEKKARSSYLLGIKKKKKKLWLQSTLYICMWLQWIIILHHNLYAFIWFLGLRSGGGGGWYKIEALMGSNTKVDTGSLEIQH